MSQHPATCNTERTAWFDAARLGLFVHFGLYSTAARHEWVMTRELMQVADYEKYAEVFDPDLFDAREIAKRAKAAGMQYAVLTSKHHDGFCLFDTKLTDYNSVQHQGRDFVAEWCDALRAEGLKVGLYYSLLDWHHPDYTIDFHHPRRNDKDAKAQNESKDFAKYREYMHAQIRELLTNYGQLDYLFFDFSYPWEQDGWCGKGAADWGSAAIRQMVHELQPQALVNDRLDMPGDLVTPEQYQPAAPMRSKGNLVRWEACQTLNGSWGYDRDNKDFKSVDLVLRMLADTVSKNGNLLLNIGPDGRGAIPAADSATLEALAAWMRLHKQAIVGAGASEYAAPVGTLYTQRADRLYIHLLAWPFAHLHLPDLAGKVKFARLLADGSEIKTEIHDSADEALTTEVGAQPPGTLTLRLPTQPPATPLPVIELLLNEKSLTI